MIVVIPRTWPLRNDGSTQDADLEWLPRICPACWFAAVVGHGRRQRQAYDARHSFILVRRGLCQQCHTTLTVLPAWALPKTHYSLAARAQAVERYVEGQMPLEQCAPDTPEMSRIADPATLRRWFLRRLTSWWTCLERAFLLVPTILAWDLAAVLRILIPEAKAT